jgi:TonB-linked SusC/RagA family outer membrane protein
MRFFIYFACFLLPVFSAIPATADNHSVQQQPKSVSGVVLDENGDPVIGANVSVSGTSLGTITDANGKFTLGNIPGDKSSIRISYLGYEPQVISIAKQTTINVQLIPSYNELDELVVVGYGMQQKKHLTGSIVTVNPAEFETLPYGNLGAMLQGEVAGLNVSGGQTRPQSQASLTIRNPFSLSKDGGTLIPIYVVDDIIVTESNFNNIDPNEIEQISIVKDAAAAVYGARGSQGAILVKTKRGKDGVPRVSYSGQFGYNDEVARPKVMSAYEYGLFWNRYAGAQGNTKITDPKKGLFQADELEAMKDMNYDWLDRAWKAATSMKHNINVSGGTKNMSFFGSVSYFTQTGNLGRLDYDKWNYRVGGDAKLASHFKISVQASGDYETTVKTFNKVGGENDENDYNTLLLTPKYIPSHIDGLPLLRYGVGNSQRNAVQLYNFFELEKRGDIVTNRPLNMRINGSLEYDFEWSDYLKGLKLKVNYSKGLSTADNSQFGSKYTGYYFGTRGGNGSHLYIGDNLLDPSNVKTTQVNNGNRLLRDNERTDTYQLNFMAIYARQFGLHNVSGLFTIEKIESDYRFVRFWKEDPLEYTLFNGESNTATGVIDGNTNRSVAGELSYIGRFNYSYADKYLFEFMIRSDASTKFAPHNYWSIFPSFSAGWVISEESWFTADWLNHLKIRASYGLLGKDNIKAWMWRQRYTYQLNKGSVFGTDAAANIGWGLKMEAAPNYDARWDKSYKHNLGIDTRFLRNRLSVGIEGYLDKNREMLVQREAVVPVTVGGNMAAENYDAIDAYGGELAIGWHDRINQFGYNISINTSYGEARYIKKDWPDILAFNSVYPGGPTDMGKWGYDYMGMFRTQEDIDSYFQEYNITKYLGLNKDQMRPGMLMYRDIRGPQKEDGSYEGPDGIVDGKDLIQLSKKSSNPYGFNLKMGGTWKDLTFSASFGASWGAFSTLPGSARSVSSSNLEYTNIPIFWNDMFTPEDILDADGNVVAPQNIDAKYPNMSLTGSNEDSRFWEVNSFRMTLRTLVVAYSIPQTVAGKLRIRSCKLNLTGTNLLSFHNPYPENFTDPMTSYGSYPVLRTWSLGVNIGF